MTEKHELAVAGRAETSMAMAPTEKHELAVAGRAETSMAMAPTEVIEQMTQIQQLMAKALKKGEHYDVIPGTSGKPSLLKAGAEKLCLMFRLAPIYVEHETIDLGRDHREVRTTCELRHINTGGVWGQGVGSCSTMEVKYRYRKVGRQCPQCGAESIIKGKAEFGGGWLCWAKKGGCGAKWNDGTPEIEDQQEGRAENDDPADQWNTVVKMAAKRAKVDATLAALAASDIFGQDLEELVAIQPPVVEVTAAPSTPAPGYTARQQQFHGQGQAQAPAAAPAQQPPPRQQSNGSGSFVADKLPPFGPGGGEEIASAARDALEWHLKNLERNIKDPSKERWRGRNQATVAAITSELSARAGGQGPPPEMVPASVPAQGGVFDQPPPSDDDTGGAIPF